MEIITILLFMKSSLHRRERLIIDTEDKIEQLFDILIELDARYQNNNCVIDNLINIDWDNLCDKGIILLQALKE